MELALSASSDDNEGIRGQVTAGQSYLIQVFGAEGDTHPNYELQIKGIGANAQPPTVDITDVTPHLRAGAVDQVAIVFSEPVLELDLADLSLRRFRDDTLSLLPGSATLSTTDNVTWVLGNLEGLTSDSGIYELSLIAAGSAIQDLDGRALAAGATHGWTNGAGDANGDRQFNQLDLIQVLRVKKYLSGQPAVWSEGDWNRDGVFDQRDLLVVLQTQPPHYLQGPFGATSATPQPQAESSLGLVVEPAASAPAAPATDQPVTTGLSQDAQLAVTDSVYARMAEDPSSEQALSDGLSKSPVADTSLLDEAWWG